MESVIEYPRIIHDFEFFAYCQSAVSRNRDFGLKRQDAIRRLGTRGFSRDQQEAGNAQ